MLKQMFWPVGRTRRLWYWAVILPVNLVLSATDKFIPHPNHNQRFMLMLLNLPAAYIGVSLLVSRLHDLDWSGWWAVLLMALLSPLGVAGFKREVPKEVALPMVIAVFAGLFFGVYLGFTRGTRGPNRFGPDPVGG
jgi:uncharacterized membrane protein YhaH (DUF805 family)